MPADNKPSRNEAEYFAKLDAERVKEQELRQVKVDVCPDCHGMWLDAGEIQRIGSAGDTSIGGFVRDLFKGLPRK